MKRFAVTVLTAAAALTLAAPAHAAGGLKLFGYTWMRYTMGFENPLGDSGVFGPYARQSSQFAIPRSYWRIEHAVSDNLKVKGTLQFEGQADKKFVSEVTEDSTGLKTKTDSNNRNWNIRVKYMEADWTVSPIARYIPDFTLNVGIQKTIFGLLDLWEYPMIQKELSDNEGLMNSADLGILANGRLPGGYGDVTVGIFNGKGYSTPFDDNMNKAVDLNLTLTPFTGIWLRGSGWLAKTPSSRKDPAGNAVHVDQNRYAGALGLAFGPATLWGEYLMARNDTVNLNGYSAWLGLQATRTLGFNLRYDGFEPNTRVANDRYSRILGGVNYQLIPGLKLMLNYQHTLYEDPARDAKGEIQLQLWYDWGYELQKFES